MSAARLRFLPAVLLLWVLVGSSHQASAPPAPPPPAGKTMRVAFINMLAPYNPMQRSLTNVVNAAAHDLGIELVQYDAVYWPERNLELVRRVVTGPQKPDYLLISMHRGIAARALEMTEQAGVPVFVIITGLTPQEQESLGKPRQRYKSWLGQMVPDDEAAGHRLTLLLAERARELSLGTPGERMGLVALEGRGADDYALKRSEGLHEALDELKDVEFLQGVYVVVWQPEMAHRRMALLLRRYPKLQLVWAENDIVALGAVQALEEMGRHPGRDVVVGGMGWTPEAIQSIREGKLAASLGGQILQGAWALVLLYDHHHGKDFASEQIDWRTEMVAITRDNVDEYLSLLGDSTFEHVDFRAFSKVANPSLKHYDFSLQAVFKQLHERKQAP